jgi:hypothetical protein
MSTEKSYKEASGFITNFINTCISLVKVTVRSKLSSSLPKAEQISCAVLGNGPSLKTSFEQHPDFFKQHALICVNNFAITPEFEKLKPQYYAMLDPAYWVDKPNKMAEECIMNLQKKTTWKLHLLLPAAAKNSKAFNELLRQNKNIEVNYYNYTVFKGFEKISHYFYRKNLAMPQSQNILVACLFLSINLGFKEIFLLGADHNWHENLHINENNQVCLKDVHFYENETQVNYRLFYKDDLKTETFKMHEIMSALGKTFYGYELMNRYAVSCGATIYNASEISFIDTFKRIKI